MKLAAFCSAGRPAYAHDMRDNISPNVDRDLISDNVILEDELMTVSGTTAKEKIDNYLNAMMQPYIDEYNRGKRADRQIKEPYMDYWRHNDKISRGQKTPVREMVLGFGEHETLGKDYYETTDPAQKEELKKVFVKEYSDALKTFKEEHPHIKVLWATIHFDERNGTPHLHVGFVGIGHKYKQSLSHQLSMGNALQCDGYDRAASRSDKDHYQLKRMYDHIREGIAQSITQNLALLQKYGDIEIKPPAPKRGHAFKEEKEQLDQEKAQAQLEIQHERDAITRDKRSLARDKETFIAQVKEVKHTLDQDKSTLDQDKEHLLEREHIVEAQEKAFTKKIEESKPIIKKAENAQIMIDQAQKELDEIERKKKKAQKEYDYLSGKNLVFKDGIGKMPEYDIKTHGHGEDRQDYYFVPKLEYELLCNASKLQEDTAHVVAEAEKSKAHYDSMAADIEQDHKLADKYRSEAYAEKQKYEHMVETADKEITKKAEEIADKTVKKFLSKHDLEGLWQDFKRSISQSWGMSR